MITPEGSIFYRDEYDTIYRINWKTIGSNLDILTITEQPYVWGEDPSGFVRNGIIFRRGIVTAIRQVFRILADGYELVAEGSSQYIDDIQTSFPCEQNPSNNARFNLNNIIQAPTQGLVTSGSGFPSLVFSQPVAWEEALANAVPPTSSSGFPGALSQYDTDPGLPPTQRRLWLVAQDDVVLDNTAVITGIQWVGAYLGYTGTLVENISGFTINFYDSVDAPSLDDIEPNFALGSPDIIAGPTFKSIFVAGSCGEQEIGTTAGGISVYSYFTEIDPMVLLANRKYWISIVPHQDSTESFWINAKAVLGANQSSIHEEQDFLSQPLVRTINSFDLAFDLVGENQSLLSSWGDPALAAPTDLEWLSLS